MGWLFVFGSSIGSFLNVVAYRLPRGESLSYPPSRCPNCQASISFRDNIPVFGWLWLRGRCRRCHEPISIRYPLVELVAGILVVYAGWLQWVDYRGSFTVRGFDDIPWLPVLRFASTALFLLTLWALALLAQDGVTVGKRIAVVVSGIEMVVLGFSPALQLGTTWPFVNFGRSLGALLVGVGCLVGIVLGIVAGKLWRSELVPRGWALVGICLGPVTTVWVFLIHLPIGLICALRPLHLVPLPVVAVTAILMSVVIQLAMTTLGAR